MIDKIASLVVYMLVSIEVNTTKGIVVRVCLNRKDVNSMVIGTIQDWLAVSICNQVYG